MPSAATRLSTFPDRFSSQVEPPTSIDPKVLSLYTEGLSRASALQSPPTNLNPTSIDPSQDLDADCSSEPRCSAHRCSRLLSFPHSQDELQQRPTIKRLAACRVETRRKRSCFLPHCKLSNLESRHGFCRIASRRADEKRKRGIEVGLLSNPWRILHESDRISITFLHVHLPPKAPNLAKVPEMTRILLGPNPSLPRRHEGT